MVTVPVHTVLICSSFTCRLQEIKVSTQFRLTPVGKFSLYGAQPVLACQSGDPYEARGTISIAEESQSGFT
jgi:hypothetical protein